MYFQQKRPLLYVLYPLAINLTPLNSYIDEIAVPRIWQTDRYDGPAVSLYLTKYKKMLNMIDVRSNVDKKLNVNLFNHFQQGYVVPR